MNRTQVHNYMIMSARQAWQLYELSLDRHITEEERRAKSDMIEVMEDVRYERIKVDVSPIQCSKCGSTVQPIVKGLCSYCYLQKYGND